MCPANTARRDRPRFKPARLGSSAREDTAVASRAAFVKLRDELMVVVKAPTAKAVTAKAEAAKLTSAKAVTAKAAAGNSRTAKTVTAKTEAAN